jgi:predicted RNA binding protein YcfA (HicA-like mRNA interferase family)
MNMPRITPIPGWKLARIIEKAGFTLVRSEGDHFIYVKEGVRRPVVIPDYPELPVFIIRKNLQTAGISREEYFRLLQQI